MMSASVRLGTGLLLVVCATQGSSARADLQLGSEGWNGAKILCCGGGLPCSEEVVFVAAALARACPGSLHQVTVQTTATGQLPFTQPQCNESADVLLRCPTGDVLLGTVPDWNGCGFKITGGTAGPFPVVAAPGCDRVVVRHAGAGRCAARDRFWLRSLGLSLGGPPPEVCNGADDDCDGLADEGLSCGPPAPAISLLSPADGAVLNLASAPCAPGPGPCVLAVAGAATDADGATATLTVDCGAGVTELPAAVTGQSVTWAGVGLLDQAVCTLDARVSTADGTAGAAPVTVLVDRVAPIIHAIARPSGDVLGPTDDENPVLPGLQKTVSVSVSGVQAGQTVEVRIVPAGSPLDGSPTLSAALGVTAPDGAPTTVVLGVWTISEAGSRTVEARVADAAGNGDSHLRVISANPSGQVVSILNAPPPGGSCGSSADCGAGVCWLGVCHIPWGIASPKQIQVQTTGVPVGSLVRLCTNLPGVAGPACATPGTVQVGVGALAATAILVGASGAPDGAQTFVAEAQVVPGADVWAASTDAGSTFQSRRVVLDTVAPVVQGITCPSDSLPPAGVLSQADQAAPGTFAFAVSATDGGVPLNGGGQLWVNGQIRQSFPITGGAGTSALDFATDGLKDVRAVVFDAVGNASLAPSSPLSLPSLWLVKVEPLSLTFLSPAGSPALAGAPLDVRLLASEAGATVRLRDGEALIGDTVTGADHQAVFPHATWGALSDGVHVLAAELEDFAGNTATAATLPASIVVDATPPEVTILAPGADLVDADDAQTSKGGFQAAAAISTAGADSWELLVQSGCAPDWSGCGGAILGASGMASGGPEAPVALTLVAPAAESWRRIEARARDAAGNVSTATRDVHLRLSACVLALAGLPADGAIRMADCAEPGCATVARTLLAEWVGPCGDVDLVTLLADGAPIDQAVPADHEAELSVVLAHGAVTSLWAEATIEGAPAAETAPFEVRVDLVPPDVDFVAGDVGGFATPESGAVVVWGAASDRAPASTTSLEGHLRVTMNDGGAGRLSLSAGGLPLAAPVSLPALPGSHDFLWISLPDQATHTVTVTAEDTVGNTTSASFTATVDLSPPEEAVLEPISALDVMPRLPAVTLRWQPPASNTGVPGGPAASYAVRYAREPITSEEDWDAACLATDLPLAPDMPAPGDPLGSLDVLTLRGPDTRSVYATACRWSALPDGMWWFAVRATDGAGNASPVSGGGTVGTDLARLRVARITHSFSPPAGFPERLDRLVVAVGDVNGDGLPDLALGGGDLSGFCLVFGRDGGGAPLPDIDLDASEGDGGQCILDPGLTGAGTPVANVGRPERRRRGPASSAWARRPQFR